MIKVRELSVSLGAKRIVIDVELLARPGEVTVIVGPNGSGKTTLMRAICGEIAYSGSVTLNGLEVGLQKPWQMAQMRAVLPQTTNLAFPFTVREIVQLGLTNGRSGARADEYGHLPELALERVDLAGFAGRFYQELSGGEQQRVQLARVLCQVWTPVLAGQPRFLLLDEPVSSLDIKHQLLVMNIAREFARSGGGVVAILHDLNLAAMFAHGMVVMSGGRSVASGAPAAILDDGLLASVFDCGLRVNAVPTGEVPFILPHTAAGAA